MFSGEENLSNPNINKPVASKTTTGSKRCHSLPPHAAVRDFLYVAGDELALLEKLNSYLDSLPSDAQRLEACEAGFADAGQDAKAHAQRKLRCSLLIAKAMDADWTGPDGKSLVSNRADYLQSLFERFGLGSTPAQLSRTPKVGAIGLQCVKAGVRLPDTAEHFIPLLKFKDVDKAVAFWKGLMAEFKDQCPTTKVVRKRVKAYLGEPEAEAAPKASTIAVQPVIQSYATLLGLLQDVAGAEKACDEIRRYQENVEKGLDPIVVDGGKEPEEDTETEAEDATESEDEGQGQDAPASPPPQPAPKPDYEREVGGLKIERYQAVIHVAWLETSPEKEAALADYCATIQGVRDDACLFAAPAQGPRWRLTAQPGGSIFDLFKEVSSWAREHDHLEAKA